MNQPDVLIVGLSHRTASLDVREAVAFADDQIEDVNRQLRALDGVDEAAVVCTCNRVEVVSSTRQGPQVAERIAAFLRRADSGPGADLTPHLYQYSGRDAVRHLFRVASSLDSMVVGEPQILGQLKQFYTRAAGVGTTGAVLHRWFHKAFSVAKRVRTETGIAGRAVSVSSAAVELAADIFDHLAGKTAMLIGTGKMGALAARHLMASGVGNLIATNRTFERAVDVAREFHGTPVPFEQFPKYLPMADIVIGSTAAGEFVLGEAQVQEALRERKGRPIFCIDLSVPRSFDPRINALDNVYLYDMDDLSKVAADNLGERAREAEKAEAIVVEEVESFYRWLGHLEVVPTIVALRDKVEAIRRGELQKTLNQLKDLGPRERELLDVMTTAIVNKILHAPIARLKQQDRRTETFYLDAARRLFDLEDPDES
ncbi:MAG TPA: glutamyl-tRNA reductase [Candidatus Dormibacteraeota bacterium]|nr:glutamyl-tRNA reductase [Candidatus Dormibacteraeota bacterium]